ncbi:MAG: immunoglobulin domain-containing protein [Bacteroidales bacterium]|nr:immunoglobulin domain-containing protein [Bacteroidales bacterium]
MKKLFYLFYLLIALTSYKINAQIINIPDDFPTIQQGIDASQVGDTVLVQPGTYVEQVIYNGKNITVGSLYLLTGNEDYIEQTIIDGGAYGLPCVRIINAETDAKLIGLTLQNGFVGSETYGGAMYITGSSPYLDHLIIKDNNSQSGKGGGISCIYSIGTVTIKNSKFFNNICSSEGGAIFLFGGDADIINCEFYNNTCNNGERRGGAIHINNINNRQTEIINCAFYNNSANNGAAIYFAESGCLTLINSIIYNNTGETALFILGGSTDCVNFVNTIISNNSTPIGILKPGTIAPRMINSIVSGHSEFNIKITGGGPIYIDYSIIQGGTSTISVVYPEQLQYWENNYDGNPLFVDPINGDYRLSDCSSGIGAGIDSLVMAEQLVTAPDYDFLNSTRPQPLGSFPDIGAYENLLGIPLTPPTITLQPIGTSKCEGESYTMIVDAIGSPEILFQWQKNGNDISGENNNVLILNNLTPPDEANYRCLVTNSCETKYSNQAFVEVKEYPDVTSQPQSEILYFGNVAQFIVGATGDDPLLYQWYGPSGLLEDDTLSQLTITIVSAADVGNYYCTITNVCGSTTSNSATLTAYDQLIISAGTDESIMLGDSTILNGSYTGGSPSLAIHWTPDTLLYDPNILNPQTVALFSSQAFTLTINDVLVGYQTSDEVSVTVIEDDTLEYFSGENDTLYQYLTRGNCGYISGNNCDLDKIKANYFTDELISYDVEKVLLRFGKAVKTSAGEVPVKIGIWAKSGDNDKPGDLINNITVPLSQIVQDYTAGIMTTVTFPTPVAAPKDFFVGVFLPLSTGDTVALMTNIDGNSEAGIAWTLNAANEWISYSSDPRFFLRVSNAIFPVVRQNNVGINEFIGTSDKLIIFPNPANDILYIMLNESMQIIKAEMIIYDLQGKAHISQQIENDKSSICISNLRPGVYIIKVKYDQTLMTRKLIVY